MAEKAIIDFFIENLGGIDMKFKRDTWDDIIELNDIQRNVIWDNGLVAMTEEIDFEGYVFDILRLYGFSKTGSNAYKIASNNNGIFRVETFKESKHDIFEISFEELIEFALRYELKEKHIDEDVGIDIDRSKLEKEFGTVPNETIIYID